MPNIKGTKMYTGPKHRIHVHWAIEDKTKFAFDNECKRLQTSKNWLVNEILKRALIMREIEIESPEGEA